MSKNIVMTDVRSLTGPALYPVTPASGDPVIMGKNIPGIALFAEDTDSEIVAQIGPIVAELTVAGVNDAGNSAVVHGDKVYYVNGDTPVLSKKASGIPFGIALESTAGVRTGNLVTAGATTTKIRVLLLTSPEAVRMSGDATITADGAMTLAESVREVTVKVSLTNAEIKALRATPKTLVAAPGAGKLLQFMRAILEIKGATNAITESADNMAIKYNDGSGVAVSDTIEATGFIDQTANTITTAVPVKDAIVTAAGSINKALVLHNIGDGEYAGNAANDATMDVYVTYRVLPVAA